MNAHEISRGIPHIEDLPLKGFIGVISYLDKYNITEKVDGSQILFGLDEHGFYTSRESKGGKRIYSVEEYKIKFSTTYMRSAHMLLESVLSNLKSAGLKIGDQVEAEVLYGELPNVVPYSVDTNHIIFLRTTEGTVNINRLRKSLVGHTASVAIDAPYTPDGRVIELREEHNAWEFSRVPSVVVRPDMLKSARKVLEQIVYFLKSPSGVGSLTNEVIESIPLNKRPEWCEPKDWKEVKEEIKIRKAEIKEYLYEGLILDVKEELLNSIVRPLKSKYGPTIDAGGFVEGIVLTDNNGSMVKIVDKEHFGKLRVDAWAVRSSLIEGARSIDGNLSFLGELYVSMAMSLGHAELGTIQAKRYLKSVGALNEDIVHTLSNGIDVDAVRDYWLNCFDLKETKLNQILDEYETRENTFSRIHRGLVLAAAVDRRTKETFADTFRQISFLRESTLQAKFSSDLFKVLIGKHLT